MYKALRNGESPSGRPLSGTYVRDISVTLHRMFRDAVKGGDADSNPCEYAEPPAIDTEQLLALPQNQPNAPLYPAGGAPGSRPGALPHFGRPRYLGPPPRARSTAG